MDEAKDKHQQTEEPTNPASNSVAEEPSSDQSEEGGSNSTLWWIVGALIVAVILIGGALYVSGMFSGGGAVAAVNGEKITRAEFEKQLEDSRAAFQQQLGGQANEEQIRQGVLQGLINQTLILQAAETADITVADEDVNEQLNEFVEQYGGEEAFEEELAKQGSTKQELQTALQKQMISNAYLNQEIATSTVEVTDEEIQEQYEALMGRLPEGQEKPPLTEVSDRIAEEVRSQKILQLQEGVIQALREDAEVEVFLDQE